MEAGNYNAMAYLKATAVILMVEHWFIAVIAVIYLFLEVATGFAIVLCLFSLTISIGYWLMANRELDLRLQALVALISIVLMVYFFELRTDLDFIILITAIFWVIYLFTLLSIYQQHEPIRFHRTRLTRESFLQATSLRFLYFPYFLGLLMLFFLFTYRF